MTREQTEAHLLLHGWQPIFYGIAGAAKQDGPSWHIVYLRRGATQAEVHEAWLGKPKFSDTPYAWGHLGNDRLFHLLADRCMQIDNDPEDSFPF